MDNILVAVAILSAFHAYTFAKWLKQNGNTPGAMGVYFLIAVGMGLSIYRLVSSF